MSARSRRSKTSVIGGKQVLLIALALFTAAVIVRGIIYAVNERGIVPPAKEAAYEPDFSSIENGITISVYDKKSGETYEMGLEEYVFCAVSGEMPASYDKEALKAQAVAARTFVIRQYERGGCNGSDADVCTDSTCCQAWRSISTLRENWGRQYGYYAKKVYEAVGETAGEYMSYNGKPILALYHSVSGGMTEDCVNVFSNELPYLTAVDSPNEEGASHYEDSVSISYTEAAERINAAFPKAKVDAGKLKTQLEIMSRYEYGRVKEVRIGASTCTGKQLRKALDLYSTNFTFEFSDSALIINTRGFGHGVGMSQAGAQAMAGAGSGYREILLHYYTGVTIGRWAIES